MRMKGYDFASTNELHQEELSCFVHWLTGLSPSSMNFLKPHAKGAYFGPHVISFAIHFLIFYMLRYNWIERCGNPDQHLNLITGPEVNLAILFLSNLSLSLTLTNAKWSISVLLCYERSTWYPKLEMPRGDHFSIATEWRFDHHAIVQVQYPVWRQ